MPKTPSEAYDVIVAGGGVSGSMAAIAAARLGAKTLVVEQFGFMGGTLTNAGVGPMMGFFAGEKQVIHGFMQEVVDRLIIKGGSKGHVRDTTKFVSFVTPFRSELLKRVLDEMLINSGAQALFHTTVADARVEQRRIKELVLSGKGGLHTVRSAVFIDATGDGDLMHRAGAASVIGRPGDSAAQPMTMKMRYAGVDRSRLIAHILSNPEEFPTVDPILLTSGEPLSIAGFASAFGEAKARGELDIPRENLLMFETSLPGEFIVNTTRVTGFDASSASSLSLAEMEGRRQAEQLHRFLTVHVPGFEQAALMSTGPRIGVRGSRQLIGRYRLTSDDVLSARRFESTVAHCGYPVDIHNPLGEGTHTQDIAGKTGRAYYDIPYEVMLSDNLDNLLVTGRCISADFNAQASMRVTPVAGSLGQAAGTAAFLSVSKGGVAADVDIRELQGLLRKNKAYIEE